MTRMVRAMRAGDRPSSSQQRGYPSIGGADDVVVSNWLRALPVAARQGSGRHVRTGGRNDGDESTGGLADDGRSDCSSRWTGGSTRGTQPAPACCAVWWPCGASSSPARTPRATARAGTLAGLPALTAEIDSGSSWCADARLQATVRLVLDGVTAPGDDRSGALATLLSGLPAAQLPLPQTCAAVIETSIGAFCIQTA